MKLEIYQNERGFWQWVIRHSRGEHRSFREFTAKIIAARDGKKMLQKIKAISDS